MKIRFQEYDNKWLYDSKENKLYDIIDDKECDQSKIDITKLTKFEPFARLTNTYVINPYKVRKRNSNVNVK